MADQLKISFIPHIRQGLATQLTDPSTLTDQVRQSINLQFKVKGIEVGGNEVEITRKEGGSFERKLELLSPIDIRTIHSKSVIKTDPADGVDDFLPNYLPYIEFYDEDFPWRYSPLIEEETKIVEGNVVPIPTEERKLTPWLTLVALKSNEFELLGYNGNNLTIRIKSLVNDEDSNVLPKSDSLWAWAHAQYNGVPTSKQNAGGTASEADMDEILNNISEDPDLAYSRIICPRKLEAEEHYSMFLIPTFELGRLAGIGAEIGAEGQEVPGLTDLAWSDQKTTEGKDVFPVYYSWTFNTTTEGDFEALVKKLDPVAQDELSLGRQWLDIQDPGLSNFHNTSDVKELPIDPVLTVDAIQNDGELWPIPDNKITYLDKQGPVYNSVQMRTELLDESGDQRSPREGRCWYFDGSSHIAFSTGSQPTVPTAAGSTLSLWFKSASATDQVLLAGSATSVLNQVGLSSGQLQISTAGSALETSVATYNDGTWHFLAISYDEVTRQSKLYVDGTLALTQNWGAGAETELSIAYIGALSAGGQGFSGSVKDLRLHNAVLSTEQMADVQDFARISTEVHWFACEEENGSLALDQGAQHGTIVSADLSAFHAHDNTTPYSFADVEGHSQAQLFNGEQLSYNDPGSNAADFDDNWTLKAVVKHCADANDTLVVAEGLCHIHLGNTDLEVVLTIDGTPNTQVFIEHPSAQYLNGEWIDLLVQRNADNFTITVNQYEKTLEITGSVDIPSLDFGTSAAGSIYLMKELSFTNLYSLNSIEAVKAGAAVYSGSYWSLSATGSIDEVIVPLLSNNKDLFQGTPAHLGRVAYNAQLVENPCLTFHSGDNLQDNNGSAPLIGLDDFYFETLIKVPSDPAYTRGDFFTGTDGVSRITFRWNDGAQLEAYTIDKRESPNIDSLYQGANDFRADWGGQWIKLGVLGNRSSYLYVLVNDEVYELIRFDGAEELPLPAADKFLKNASVPTHQAAYFKLAQFSNGLYSSSSIANINWDSYGVFDVPLIGPKVYNTLTGEKLDISSADETAMLSGTQEVYNYQALYGYTTYNDGVADYDVPHKRNKEALTLVPDPGHTLVKQFNAGKALPAGDFTLNYALGITGRDTTAIRNVLSGDPLGAKDHFALDHQSQMRQLSIDLPFAGFSNAWVAQLVNLLNGNQYYQSNETTTDPEVTPPLYGQWYMNQSALDADASDWFHRVNLDPRYRYLAGLGRKIVRENQSYFLKVAWQQAEEVIQANKAIIYKQLQEEANKKGKKKGISIKSDEEKLVMTAGIHDKVISATPGETVWQSHQTSNLPDGIFGGASRRLSGKGSLLEVNLSVNTGTQFSLSQAVSDFATVSIEAEPVYAYPSGMETITVFSQSEMTPLHVSTLPARPTFVMTDPGTAWVSPGNGGTDNTAAIEFRQASMDASITLEDAYSFPTESIRPVYPTSQNAGKVDDAVDVDQLYKDLLNDEVNYTDANGQPVDLSDYHKILFGPVIDLPIFDYLYAMNADTIIPGINDLVHNTVTTFTSNQKTIEAVMLGVNDEMNRELQFHAYPATKRTTVFRRFWNSVLPEGVADDDQAEIEKLYSIKKILDWEQPDLQPQKLGLNLPDAIQNDNLLILAIKGDVLRKFPHTAVYMQKAKWPDTMDEDFARTARELETVGSGIVKTPLFFAQAGDALLLGFDVNETQAKGTVLDNSNPGWFFVFEEAYGDVHFGMDDAGLTPPGPGEEDQYELDFWDDLDWSLATLDAGPSSKFVDLGSVVSIEFNEDLSGDLEPLKNQNDLRIDFGRNSADNAYALFQKPVRLIAHSNELL